MITEQQYTRYARQGYAKIALVQELPAGLDTPLGIYLKLANAPFGYLLESASQEERLGRFSIIGLPCKERLEIRGDRLTWFNGNTSTDVRHDAPLDYLEHFLAERSMPNLANAPRFSGGLVGYFGYEISGLVEPCLANIMPPANEPDVPDALLMVSDEVIVLDRLRNMLHIVVCANTHEEESYEKTRQRVARIAEQLRDTPVYPPRNETLVPVSENDFSSLTGESAFKSSVEDALRYIEDGDIMQVVVSQRLQARFTGSPLSYYRSLRHLNPSPYMYYLDLGEFHVVGSSPEILIRKENELLTLSPIAGTRPRSEDPKTDRALATELLNDPKELAEHLMLVDLGRNDLGRVCETGSVTVEGMMKVERYSHVMHIVSNIVGRCAQGVSTMDILKASFPAGTVTGAPKIRAMELIAQFEPVRRSIYAGSVGYISWDGAIDTAIAIRTALIKDQTIYAQAGAGLVFDSQPQNEWNETMNKAQVLIQAAVAASQQNWISG